MYLPTAEVCAQEQSPLYKLLHLYEQWLEGECASQRGETHGTLLTGCMVNKLLKNNFTEVLPHIYMMALHVSSPGHVSLITCFSKQETNILNAHLQLTWLHAYE